MKVWDVLDVNVSEGHATSVFRVKWGHYNQDDYDLWFPHYVMFSTVVFFPSSVIPKYSLCTPFSDIFSV